MSTSHKVGIVATFALIATIAGILAGLWANPTTDTYAGRTGATQTRTIGHKTAYVYNSQPNNTMPFLSEDRYIDGRWTNDTGIVTVTPVELPHASGTCVDCP